MSNYKIIDDLIASLPVNPITVRSVLVGAHWTTVWSTHCGLATTIIGNKPHDHTTVVRDVGRHIAKVRRNLLHTPFQKIHLKRASVLLLLIHFWK